jgi:molybdate transport system substrate-binding protein
MPHRGILPTLIALSAALVVACTGAPAPSSPRVTPPPEPTSAPVLQVPATLPPIPTLVPTVVARQTSDPTAVVIFAASTFGAAFTELGSDFMMAAPGATGVSYRFDNSVKLRSMIQQGADADVFATVDPSQMDPLQQANLLDGSPSILASDQLVIVVSKANPQQLQAFKDLGNAGVRFIVPAPDSPTTTAMLKTFDAASSDPAYGADFRQRADRNVLARDGDDHEVLTRIIAGEVSAGVVYASSLDPQSRSQVQVITLPPALNASVNYPIAVLKNGTNMHGGEAFIKYIMSSAAQDILSHYGFAAGVSTNAAQ